MFYQFNNVEIFYKRANQGSKTVLLMHGFGADSKAMDCLFYFFKNRGYSVLSVDFAGFGQSEEPKNTWSIYDYADSVEELIRSLKLSSVIGVGHSFGGRVGLILASRGVLSSLILIDSAGLKPRRKPLYYIKVYSYKLGKKLGLKQDNAGSADYQSLTNNMKATFTKVVNEHLDKILPVIYIPTLILWGEEDMETPLYMAKKLNKKIKDSSLIILEGGHYSYMDSYEETCVQMEKFICSQE